MPFNRGRYGEVNRGDTGGPQARLGGPGILYMRGDGGFPCIISVVSSRVIFPT